MPEEIASRDESPSGQFFGQTDQVDQSGDRVIYPYRLMNQAQSKIAQRRSAIQAILPGQSANHARRRVHAPVGQSTQPVVRAVTWSITGLCFALFRMAWSIITLPFRLVFWAIAWMGRLMGAILGFSLMVGGMALLASPFYIVGIPLFFVGLVVTLRCLE